MHLLHPSICPGLLQTCCPEPFPNRALGLAFSAYLSAPERSGYNIKYIRGDKEIGHDEYILRQGGKKTSYQNNFSYSWLHHTLLRHSADRISIEGSSCTKLLHTFVLTTHSSFSGHWTTFLTPHLGYSFQLPHCKSRSLSCTLDLPVHSEGLGYDEVSKLALD